MQSSFIFKQQMFFDEKLKPHKLPKTQYLGSKEKLVKWIYDHSPKNIETFFDAFSGTSSVGYYFKTQGKQVISNDFLKFNYHIGKALIENQKITLNKEDIDILLQTNKTTDSFIENTFTGVFFERSQARFLDHFRSNVELLHDKYKQSLAFTIINRALTKKILLGHFAHLKALTYSKNLERIKRNPTIIRPIKDLFLELIHDYNKAVFDNKKENKIYCEDTIPFIKKLKNIDLAYFDPPYYGCHPDYQAFYHFLETYVEYWKDKKFINKTKQYFPKKKSGFIRKDEIIHSFKQLFENSVHIPYWLISYNSRSYPDQQTMEDLIRKFRQVKVFEYEYQNHYGGRGSRRGTKEYLFLGYKEQYYDQ